jgi:iron(III) transport system substrate-binding protein
MDKLAAQKPRVVQSAVDTTTYLVRGEALLASGSGSYVNFNAKKKGEPIEMIVPKEGVPFISSPQAIFKKAPHPNAAKIFSDWLFSLEAQQILADRGLYVGHPDVKYPAGLVPLSKLKLMTLDPEEGSKMTKPIRDAFRKKFGV